MTTALKFLSQITNDFFERRMTRAAIRISANQTYFVHHIR
jgi:hypothetical protein